MWLVGAVSGDIIISSSSTSITAVNTYHAAYRLTYIHTHIHILMPPPPTHNHHEITYSTSSYYIYIYVSIYALNRVTINTMK